MTDKVKECVKETISLAYLCGVVNDGVLNYQDSPSKSSNTKDDLMLLEQKVNQLRSLFEDNQSDIKDDHLRNRIKDMIIIDC